MKIIFQCIFARTHLLTLSLSHLLLHSQIHANCQPKITLIHKHSSVQHSAWQKEQGGHCLSMLSLWVSLVIVVREEKKCSLSLAFVFLVIKMR